MKPYKPIQMLAQMMTKTLNLMMTHNKTLMFGGQLPMIMVKLLQQEIPMEPKLLKLTTMLKFQEVRKLQLFIQLTVVPHQNQ
jgi:hypothetical protein